MTKLPPASSYLLFVLGRWEFALPSRLVCSIVPATYILPFPNTPAWLAGLLHSGAEATPAIDLRIRLGIASGVTQRVAIVIQPPLTIDNCPRIGLLVDRVMDTALIRPPDLRPIRGLQSQAYKDFLSNVWRGRSRPCYLVDLEKLVPPDFALHLQAIFSSLR